MYPNQRAMNYLHNNTPSTSPLLLRNENLTSLNSTMVSMVTRNTSMTLGLQKVTEVFTSNVYSIATTMASNAMKKQDPDKLTSVQIHILGFFMISLVIFAIIGNSTLMGVIVTVRKLHSKAHIFIVDLTVSDMLVALTVMPVDIESLINGGFFHGVVTCEFVSVMFFMSLPASALSLSLLTLERYITLKYPLTHHKVLTKKRAIAALIIKWLYVTIIASLPAMGWVSKATTVRDGDCMFFFTTNYAIFMLSVNFVLPLFIILFANIEIFRIANHAALKMQKSVRRSEKRRASLIAIGANVKAAKKIMLLVGLFMLSWFPYIVNTIVNISCDKCHSQFGSWIILALNFSNSAMNPILYGLLNKDVRHEIRKLLREMSFKCTKNKFDKPFQRASRTECMHSVSIATEREVFNVKSHADETTL